MLKKGQAAAFEMGQSYPAGTMDHGIVVRLAVHAAVDTASEERPSQGGIQGLGGSQTCATADECKGLALRSA
jgi:hypothetical protein